MKVFTLTMVIAHSLVLLSCTKAPSDKSEVAPTAATPAKPAVTTAEPDYIRVQHVLIGFKDAVGFSRRTPPPGASKRSRAEAEQLANEVLARAKKGEDFGELVKQYTDDSPPGIYGLANTGKPKKGDYYSRSEMAPAFGDIGFPLTVGGIGMASYDAKRSPFGWHIIKRIE